MSRPEPKPATLEPIDAAAYGLAHERQTGARAQLDAARARLQLAELAAQTAEQGAQAALQQLATKYQIGDGDGFNWQTRQITRAPVSPTNAELVEQMKTMQRELLQEIGSTRDTATAPADPKETAPPAGANGAADHVS